MMNLIVPILLIAAALPAQAKIRNVVNCADEFTSVQVNTSGEYGNNNYRVIIEDKRNGEKFPYWAVLRDGSFVSIEKGNPTINTSPTSIAFVKSGWGLVVIEGENCDINLD